jgi:hypothetical protein
MGDACRFSHAAEGPMEGSTGVGQWRRPLLHIIVLFAADTRTGTYARVVANRFQEAGVDVFLHVSLGLGFQCGKARRGRGEAPSRAIKLAVSPAFRELSPSVFPSLPCPFPSTRRLTCEKLDSATQQRRGRSR